MRKHVFGRQFKRDSNERKALFKSLICALILRDSIKTTREKAKAISGAVDKIVTLAKRGSNSKNLLEPLLPKSAVDKLMSEIMPRFTKRHGGYTRIVEIGRRLSDNAQMVLMEWTDKEINPSTSSGEKFPPKADQPLAEKIKNTKKGENKITTKKKIKRAKLQEKKEVKK